MKIYIEFTESTLTDRKLSWICVDASSLLHVCCRSLDSQQNDAAPLG